MLLERRRDGFVAVSTTLMPYVHDADRWVRVPACRVSY